MSVRSNNKPIPAVEAVQVTSTPASLPLYFSALVVIECGLLAVSLILNDDGFSNLTMGLAAIGVIVSYISRKQSVAPKSIEIPALLLCIFLAFVAYFSDRLLPFLAPADIADDRSKGLAVMLTWLLVFWSFALTLDGAILFCCVPVVAIFGLAGHMTTDSALVVYFSAFVGAAAFMLVHENFLSRRYRTPRSRRSPAEQTLLAGQIQIAALCGIGALICGKIVAPVLEGFGSQFSLTAGIMQPGQRSADRTLSAPLSFSEQKTVDVGLPSPTLSDRVVMRVKAPVGTNWRGGTLNDYTGRGWRSSISGSRVVAPDPQKVGADDVLGDQTNSSPIYHVPISPISATGQHTSRITQEVQFLSTGTFGEVYAAPECRVVHTGESDLTVDADGSIHFPRQTANIHYIVESEVPERSGETLRNAAGTTPREIRENYTAFSTPTQPDAAGAIKQAAVSAVAGKRTTYDKVTALKDLITGQCKYSTNAGAYPTGVDVTSYFLFTGKQGDCNSFATALAVLCRAIGIPSRVASGFLSGIYDQSAQEYFVREKDKHLWTEVYFPSVGWVSFDATEDADVIESADADKTLNRRKGLFALLFQHGILPPLALLVFFTMLGYVLKVEVLDRFRVRSSIDYPLGLPATNIAVIEAYEQASRLLARKGLPRPSSATPTEYQAIVSGAIPISVSVIDPHNRLTSQLNRYRYGKVTATDEDVRQALSDLDQLKINLKSVKHVRPVAAQTMTPEQI